MIHLKFDLNQIKISKSFDFSKKNECILILVMEVTQGYLILKQYTKNTQCKYIP